jgi:hypothetical protein
VSSRTAALEIAPPAAGAALTPAQKRFNTLLRQIEQARKQLASWQQHAAAYRKAYAELLRPLEQELLQGERQWVQALDAALDQKNWSKAERITLRDLLCEAAGELLDAQGDDAEVKALFDKHSEVDYDTEQRELTLMMIEVTEAMTGLDLGDAADIENDEDLLARMRAGLEQREAQEEARRAARAQRPKSAAQQRRESEAKEATQSVREIYRRLASALHPDRETDAHQREEKTALMQRVNRAYEANDLLGLLELQLQIEQIAAAHVANASAARLKHYNKVLGDQLLELKDEIDREDWLFRMEFDLEAGLHLNPDRLHDLLERTQREWRADLAEQQARMRMLGDVAATKRWLKRERRRLDAEEFGFNPF